MILYRAVLVSFVFLTFYKCVLRVTSQGLQTTEVPETVSRCYKCEGNCNGEIGELEDCHPQSDHYTCYKIIVAGHPFQRGCTRDFSEGEDCVIESGREYCFCRKDACNLGSKFRVSTGAVIVSSIILMWT